MRIQAVEDNPDIALLLCHALEGAGHEVRTWTHRFDLLTNPEPWKDVDVALVDLWLTPSGVEHSFSTALGVLRYLKDTHPQIQRFVCTAIPSFAIPDEVHALAEHILNKPVSGRELLDRIGVGRG